MQCLYAYDLTNPSPGIWSHDLSYHGYLHCGLKLIWFIYKHPNTNYNAYTGPPLGISYINTYHTRLNDLSNANTSTYLVEYGGFHLHTNADLL